MSVPQYDSQKVQSSPFDAARLDPGSVSNNLGTVGHALAGAAGAISELQKQGKAEGDALRVEDAVNQLRAKQQEYTGWVRNLQGRNALDPEKFGGQQGQNLEEVAQGWMAGAADEILQTLTNEDQKKKFKWAKDRLQLEFGGHVQDHLNHQVGVVAKDTFASTLSTETQQLAIGAVKADGRLDGDTIAQSLGRIMAASQSYANSTGLDAKAIETEALSSGHAVVLDALLKRNNTQGAQVYFDTYKGQMEKQVISAMETKIQQATLANGVQTQADRIASLGIPLDRQEEEAAKAFKGNAEGLQALRAELEHRFNIKKTAQSVAQQETFGKLWDMRFPTLPGQQAVSMPQVMRSPEWAALNGTQRNELRAQWDSYSKRNENDPAVQVARFATYMRILDDPESLVKMSDSQISSYMGTLGPEYTNKLMEMKRKAAGSLYELNKATLNDLPFKDIVGEYGIKVKGSLTQDHLATLGAIRDKALDAIREEQKAVGKSLLPDRKEEILRSLLVKTKTSWFGKDQHVFQADSFMDLPGTPEEKQQAVELLVQADALVTPANVNTMLQAIKAKREGK